MAYPDGRGGLKVWSAASGWHELNLDTCWYSSKPSGPFDASHVLRLLPQRSLQIDGAAGSKAIQVNGVGAADPSLSVKSRQWFQQGQRIVIDPGASDQEIATVKSEVEKIQTDILTLSSPLHSSYLGGTLVSVLPVGGA